MVVPECHYPLLGHDLCIKMGVQTYFLPEGATITGPKGEPIQVLTIRLKVEYKLFENIRKVPQKLDWWLQKYIQTWAETRSIGKATNQPHPLYIPQLLQYQCTSTP